MIKHETYKEVQIPKKTKQSIKFDIEIKYSPVTQIFYTTSKGQLYRYNSCDPYAIWVKSDFKDINNGSKIWKNASKEQIEKYKLMDKFANVISYYNPNKACKNCTYFIYSDVDEVIDNVPAPEYGYCSLYNGVRVTLVNLCDDFKRNE